MRVAANEKAEAEKILQIKRAEGEAESKYLSGLGIARQRQAIVDGLRDSVLGFSVNVQDPISDIFAIKEYFPSMFNNIVWFLLFNHFDPSSLEDDHRIFSL